MRIGRLGRRLFLLLGCAAALAVPAHAADWPRFRGPNGTGVSDDANIPVTWNDQQGVRWKVAIPGAGNSSPIVWGDRLFLESAANDGSNRQLLCLDAATGRTIWTRSVPGGPALIHKKNSLASPTPATDGKRVYTLFWDGKDIALHAFDLDGKPLWHTDLGSFTSQHGAGHSPIVYDGKVYLANDQDGSAALVALDAETGRIAWQAKREAFRTCYSTPFVYDSPADGPELIVSSTSGVTGYDPKTGHENWHWHWAFTGMALRTVGSPVAGAGLLFANSGDGSGARHTVAVRPGSKGADTSHNLVWEQKRDLPYVPCYLTRGTYLYSVTDKGMAGCREAATGKVVWHERLGGDVSASPLLIDGKVYACGEDGEVYVFAAEPTFRLLATNTIGEPITATPAVADGRLFIRGKNHLFCIARPAAK
jgi:outer membrane protein assembly factor BamB